nr:vesicle-fusing ATPase [Andalucia godoyi]|eukprot:ANDGO_07388.mRNA.1 Vesicle-fusing ATPase
MPTFALKIGNAPSANLLSSNLAFVSAQDFPPALLEQYPLLLIKANVYRIEANGAIEKGSIGLNAIQRRSCAVSTGVAVDCTTFSFEGYNQPHYDSVSVEVAPVVKGKVPPQGVDGIELESLIWSLYAKHVVRTSQEIVLDYHGTNIILNIVAVSPPTMPFGMLEKGKSIISFAKPRDTAMVLTNVASQSTSNVIFKHNFDFQTLGIGGLDNQFSQIFRRAFASRIFPPEIVNKLHINHVKGILLYGPPGTGKTLIARQIGKMLNCKEPKIVNGPEVLSKFVGESEERVRQLFEDAEKEQKANPNGGSQLHLIIFDEIDAICKQRGTVRNGTGVNDSIVNQLLSKIDGVESLNNVLIIGMTNRRDMLDEALLRPGRFEVQVEIGLPDEAGRQQILSIHTRHLKENKVLGGDVSLEHLATETKNFSGAEIEGLVKSAVSFAFNRQIDPENPAKPIDPTKMQVTAADFESALVEVRPAYGVNEAEMTTYLAHGLVRYGPGFEKLYSTLLTLAKQVEQSDKTSLLSVLLHGEQATGKTCIAAHIALAANFPFVKVISPEQLVGDSEASKCMRITKVFDDAYKTPIAVIVLDNIERLVEYVDIGPRFSNAVLQTILVLLGKRPPKGRKLFIIGTTSSLSVLKPMEVAASFNLLAEVKKLDREEAQVVTEEILGKDNLEERALGDDILPQAVGIKRLLLAVEMARARASEQSLPRITREILHDCFASCGCYEDQIGKRTMIRLMQKKGDAADDDEY